MSVYKYKVLNNKGEEVSLEQYKGKILLIVNTATGCGFTPQYKGLEELYLKYQDKGLVVLDFPCNQFGHQAPGTDDEIHTFCTAKYDTHFDQLAKIDVNGETEDPLYSFLKEAQPKEEVKGFKNKAAITMIKGLSKTYKKPSDIVWNFTKFIVDKEGNVVGRYDPTFKPLDFENQIIELLK